MKCKNVGGYFYFIKYYCLNTVRCSGNNHHNIDDVVQGMLDPTEEIHFMVMKEFNQYDRWWYLHD